MDASSKTDFSSLSFTGRGGYGDYGGYGGGHGGGYGYDYLLHLASCIKTSNN